MTRLGQDNLCQYHSEHHAAIGKIEEDIEKLYAKINDAEKTIIKLETKLENSVSKTFIFSVAASILASLIILFLQYVLK